MEATTIDTAMQSALQSFSGGRLHESEERCRWILSIQPAHAPALNLLATLAHRAGFVDDAIRLIGAATSCDPRVAEYHSNAAVMLSGARRFEEACAASRRAIAIDASLVDAHYNLGIALQGAERCEDAVSAYRDALALRYDHPDAHNNLGNALKALGRLAEATAAYRQALFFQPGHALARGNLASILEDTGLLAAALEEHRRAVDAAPNHPAIHSNLILDLHYQPTIDAAAILAECRRWNARHAEPLGQSVPDHDRTIDRPLRIGYVSADLRRHAVAAFLMPLLRSHDRGRVHVTCYPTVPFGDDVTERLRQASDGWTSLAGLTNEAAARRIRDDRIDVLVDLGGHTSGNRLPLFAGRCAPVQITYLGHPGTTGIDAVDGRVTDVVLDPPGLDNAASERPLRIAPTAWCFEAPTDAPAVGALPALRDGHVTFGSFNALKKIGPSTVDLWGALLQRLPTARLIVKNHALRDAETAERLRGLFRAAGIDAARIDLLPDEPTQRAHLQVYDRIDIALDPFPYHGTTTTCEALWMGVPVVTLAGRTHVSRVGASLLSAVGLSQLIADDARDYVDRAVRLAGDLSALAALREGLRERMRGSPLMDAARFASRFESAIRDQWRVWCESSAG